MLIKKYPIAIFIMVSVQMYTNHCIFGQCKVSQITADNKVKIPAPYKYDGFLMKEFTFGLIIKNIPVEFVAFKNQNYKLIFCSSDFEEPVIISIFDKAAPTVKIAEKIIGKGTKNWEFEPSKAGTYSIVYEIPPSDTDIEHKACIVLLIGFSEK